jgi:glutathione S-transferase
MREIHGRRDCPFAWRVRIAAREKTLPFDWIPLDVPEPDPRSRLNNPRNRSPLLVEDGFQLAESLVILAYLAEAYPGAPLEALGARERSLMRLRLEELALFEVLVEAGTPVEPKVQAQIAAGWETLEQLLAGGREWLGGVHPDLSDVAIWPFLYRFEEAGLAVPADAQRAAAYWRRARERRSLTSTRPTPVALH